MMADVVISFVTNKQDKKKKTNWVKNSKPNICLFKIEGKERKNRKIERKRQKTEVEK